MKDYLDYNEATTWERLKYSLKSWRYIGVGKSLLIWFLAISFVPLATVSFINFLNAYQGLTIVAEKSLIASSQLRVRYIYTFFDEATDFLDVTEESPYKNELLKHLQESYDSSGLDAAAFVKTRRWKELSAMLKKELSPSLQKKEFYDFLYIDTKGNILFRTKGDKDLGMNIFSSELNTTKLAKTAHKALQPGQMGKSFFSDLEHYKPSFNIISGFLIKPLMNKDREAKGLLVLQVTMDIINDMIQQEAGYGETGDAFIIGDDLFLRSATRFGDENEILRKKVENKKTLAWRDFLHHRGDKLYLKNNELDLERVTTYDATGKGKYVLGIYRNLDKLEKYGLHWALVEEIEHSEAFAYARRLSDIVKISFIITIIVVFFISILVTRWFVNPIKQLSSWAKQISTGLLVERNVKAPQNEIGEMRDTFTNLVKSLKRYANIAKLVAKGDFSEKVDERSKDDVLARSINQMVESFRSVVAQANRIAAGDYNTLIKPRSENDSLGKALYKMTETLRKNAETFQREDWIKTGLNELDKVLKGKTDIALMAQGIISFFSNYVNAQAGLIYLFDDKELNLKATYGVDGSGKEISKKLKPGEGIVGQAFADNKKIFVKGNDKQKLIVDLGVKKAEVREIIAVPFSYKDEVIGVMELAKVTEFSELEQYFLDLAIQDIALAIITLQSHLKVKELLERTQQQAKELEVQQEELRQANEELQEQTEALRQSERNLQEQQEELKVTNEELEERTKALEIQRDAIRRKNKELELARKEIEKKAKDLELASKYKSEFLANMSHELRTPLNSIIVLSQLLNENKKGHLDDKEKEFAKTINSSGLDLLDLINDILDLSKVESGAIELAPERLYLKDLEDFVKSNFEQVVRQKGLQLKIEKEKDLPSYIITDVQRVQQIVKNLISNAIKFTQEGSITFGIRKTEHKYRKEPAIAISVADTGIGIPKEKQEVIFEAFKQADGTTSRKYGGTGLGLSISRNFSQLLGGYMELNSEEGKGSKFTLVLPLELSLTEEDKKKETDGLVVQKQDKTASEKEKVEVIKDDASTLIKENEEKPATQQMVTDDRNSLVENDKVILIIEDDVNFAGVLLNLAHEHGFKGIIALSGEVGLYHADYYTPNAIILDMGLPGISGSEVLEKLKENPKTRAIPVHVISAKDFDIKTLKQGAIGYLTKPVKKPQLDQVFDKIEKIISKPLKKLLVVEDEEITRKSIEELMSHSSVEIVSVDSGEKALKLLKSDGFDCMILDLGLKGMTGFELLEKINSDEHLRKIPVVIYTSKDLTEEENETLKKYAQSIILKGARSFERLLAETTLFLHQVDNGFSNEKKKMMEKAHGKENVIEGKTIMIVDDDMRNVFALSSVLEEYKARIVVAKNGREAIDKLHANPDVNLILMDIMMPEMDGYEAMRRIRKEKKYKNLPIIALTAKAMKGDREKCIAAGANEYLAKPVEKEKLISLLRVWLYK